MRLQNERVDIGADEYGTAVGVLNMMDGNQMAWRTDYVNDQLVISWEKPLRYQEKVILIDVMFRTLSTHDMCYGDQSVTIYFGGLPPGTYYAFLRGMSVVVPLVVPD